MRKSLSLVGCLVVSLASAMPATSGELNHSQWKTFERAPDCQGDVVWSQHRLISSNGELREAAWQSPCPVMQLGRIQFDCRMGLFRKQLPGWRLGPWKQPESGSREQQDLRKSCRLPDS